MHNRVILYLLLCLWGITSPSVASHLLPTTALEEHQIHKPLNITGWIQEQEENKYVSEEDMIKRTLESIRIAYANKDSFTIEKRGKYSTFFWSSVTLRDKKNYEIEIQVHKPGKYPVYYPMEPQATITSTSTAQIQVRKSKPGWHYWNNHLDKTFNIECGSSSGSRIISITTELGEKQSLLNYLYPRNLSLVNQHKNEALEELDTLEECEGKGLLETFPKEYYPDIKIATRRKLIRCLLDEWEVTGEDETLILDLIQTTPNSHARSLFDSLNNGTSYMKAFISKLDNHGVFGGKRNFDRFALVWLDLFYRAHTVDELKEKYHEIDSNTHRIYHYGHYNYGIDGEDKVISRVKDDRIIFTEEEVTEYIPPSNQHKALAILTGGGAVGSYTKEQREYSYSLNDLIAVYFVKEEKIAECTFKGVMLLPVSTYHVIVNSATNDQTVTLLNAGINILSIAIPFDEFVLLGQIMKKAGTFIRTLRTFRAKEFARRIKTATDKQFQGRLPKNADKVVDALKGKSTGKVAKGVVKSLDEFWARIPAQFRKQVQNAFKSGTAKLKHTDSEMTLYRHISKGAPDKSFWYAEEVLSPEQARKLLALPDDNTAKWIVEVKVKKGTPYIEGTVASQVDNVVGDFGKYATGGGKQLYFLQNNVDNSIQVIKRYVNIK